MTVKQQHNSNLILIFFIACAVKYFKDYNTELDHSELLSLSTRMYNLVGLVVVVVIVSILIMRWLGEVGLVMRKRCLCMPGGNVPKTVV